MLDTVLPICHAANPVRDRILNLSVPVDAYLFSSPLFSDTASPQYSRVSIKKGTQYCGGGLFPDNADIRTGHLTILDTEKDSIGCLATLANKSYGREHPVSSILGLLPHYTNDMIEAMARFRTHVFYYDPPLSRSGTTEERVIHLCGILSHSLLTSDIRASKGHVPLLFMGEETQKVRYFIGIVVLLMEVYFPDNLDYDSLEDYINSSQEAREIMAYLFIQKVPYIIEQLSSIEQSLRGKKVPIPKQKILNRQQHQLHHIAMYLRCRLNEMDLAPL